MLLYSTILDVNDTLTKDAFVELVIDWNQQSPHEENRVPGIEWDGSRDIRYGEPGLSLEFMEYRNKDIVAARYEKIEEDGAVWNTDFVMNFERMQMSIQLDRSYGQGAVNINPKFSVPHFVTLLIENGYLKSDNGLEVLAKPHIITEDCCSLAADVINGDTRYRLPVVYVTKTHYNHDPVMINRLCGRVKGAAHVMLQEDKATGYLMRRLCDGRNEYGGAIGIYYPSEAFRPQRFRNMRWDGEDAFLLNKVVQAVLQYGLSQKVDALLTWDGVRSALLTDKYTAQKTERIAAETAQQMAQEELDEYFSSFDEENAALRQQIEELKCRVAEQDNRITALTSEATGLRMRLGEVELEPLLVYGNEDDFYDGEIRDIVLGYLDDALKKTESKTRRADILRDLLNANKYQHISEKKKKRVKNLFKGYKGMNGTVSRELEELGFKITKDGGHYKLIYHGDSRYMTTVESTPSDWRGEKNEAAQICKQMF